MPVSARIMTYEGDKQDGSPPVAEDLAVVTCIFLLLSHHGGKHYGRPLVERPTRRSGQGK